MFLRVRVDDVGLGVFGDAKDVGVVELNLGAGLVAGRDLVARHQLAR